MKRAIFTVLFGVEVLMVLGQCRISTPRTEICKGDIITFTVQASKTISNYQWFFGTGQSSVQASPSASFQATGDFWTTCEVIYTDGTKCYDSLKISVFDVPIANLEVDASSVFCEDENNICIKDISTSPSGKSIVQRNFIWGDGAADLAVSSVIKCHHYDNFGSKTIRIEVADAIGCTSDAVTTVSLRKNPAFLLSIKVTDEDCYSGNYCAVVDLLDPNIEEVNWTRNNKKITPTSNILCFSKSGKFKEEFSVNVKDSYGCKSNQSTSISREFKGQNGPARIKIDTVCFGDNLLLDLRHLPVTEDSFMISILDADIKLKFEDVFHPVSGDSLISISYEPDTIGVHYFNISSLNAPNDCGYNETILAWVRGPYIRVGTQNGAQCVPRDTVGFYDLSGYFLNSQKMGYTWKFGDEEADNSKDLNPTSPYYNYGYSTARVSKHFYPKLGCYKASFHILDSVYGCEATTSFYVTTGYPALTKLSIIDKKEVYCEGDSVFYNVGLVRYKDQSIDPAHKRPPRGCVAPSSLSFETIVPSEFGIAEGKSFFTFFTDKQCEPEDLTLISGDGKKFYYPNGSTEKVYINDTVCYATTKYLDEIKVDNVPDVKFDLVSTSPVGCDKMRVAVRIKSTELISRFKINWTRKDSLVKDYGRLVLLDTIVKIEMNTGTYKMYTSAYSSCGCETLDSFQFAEGLKASINANAACGGEFFDISGSFDYLGQRNFTGRTENENVSWKFDTLAWGKYINDVIPHDTFGVFPVYLAYSDYSGSCKDTIFKLVKIKKVDAKFSSTNETNICEKLIQYTDRSIVLSEGRIVKWEWNLDNGVESTLQNPYQYYARKGSYRILLTAYSEEGCSDTVSKFINLEGPVPYFDFTTDTIGCYPLEVGFVNKSKNSKAFLWEWHDHIGSIESSPLGQDSLSHTYTKAGIYYPVLRAFDTVYNGANYYICDDIYPNEEINDPQRTIEVIDSVNLKFSVPEKICHGENISIENNTWRNHLDYFGRSSNDTTDFSVGFGKGYSTDKDTGLVSFTFFAKPKPGSIYPSCSDTFRISSYVEYVEADFTHCFRLNPKDWTVVSTRNKSSYKATKFIWRDVQDNLIYDDDAPKIKFYGARGDGKRDLCLEVETDFGCKDEKCVTVEIPKLGLYNVFTPDGDGYNNDFDIDIEYEKSYNLTIFNRYGEMVYEANSDFPANSGLNWNGNYMNEGGKLPEGTYFYTLKYSFDTCLDKVYVTEGMVDIIR